MRIDIIVLKKAIQKIFDHLKEMDIKMIEIDKDLYWNIPEEEKYNVHKEPKDLDIGSLSDDLQKTILISEGNKDPTSYDLVCMASLLRAVGVRASKNRV